MKSYMKRKTLPFRLGYIEVARLPDGDNFRRPHTLPSSPRGFDAATLSAGCSRFARQKSSMQTAFVERSIKKVRRPAFSAEETRIKARKLPLLIGSLIGPPDP